MLIGEAVLFCLVAGCGEWPQAAKCYSTILPSISAGQFEIVRSVKDCWKRCGDNV